MKTTSNSMASARPASEFPECRVARAAIAVVSRRAIVVIASVITVAILIASPVAALAQWDRDAVFRQMEDRLRAQVQARPDNAGALVELAAFYLRPVAIREVAAADGRVRPCPAPLRDEVIVGGSKDVYAVPWVFRGDAAAAQPLLAKALQLEPGNGRAHREMAIVYRMRQDVVRMQQHVLPALKADPTDLDMARLYLDFHTVQARILNDRAAALRRTTVREEQRGNTRYRVTTHPSAADLAEARRLDEQAQQHRREAFKPLRQVMMQTKRDPAQRSRYDLANAIYYHWIGELGTAAGAAKAALEADPTNLDALDYMIDLARGTHTRDLYEHYLGIRDRWAGASTAIRSAPARPGRPKG